MPSPLRQFCMSNDAFLARLLIALMQSICLEGQGGESRVEPRLQETTFIQHTFGGRLRSKVQTWAYSCSFALNLGPFVAYCSVAGLLFSLSRWVAWNPVY